MKKKLYIQPAVMTMDCYLDNPFLAGSVTTVDSGDADLFIDDDEDDLEDGRSRGDRYDYY